MISHPDDVVRLIKTAAEAVSAAYYGCHLHAFVDEAEVQAAVAEDPAAFEPLRWGQRIRGLRIRLAAAPAERVAELIEESWRRKASARLVADFEQKSSR
jgi:hypothetical protein